MNAGSSRTPALEQGGTDYERLRQLRRERRQQAAVAERRTRLVLAVVSVLGFVGLLVAGVAYQDRLLQTLANMTESSPDKRKSYRDWLPQSLRAAIESGRSDEDRKFTDTRTGQVRSFVGGNTCRDRQFDNSAGRFVGDTLRQCDSETKSDPGVAQTQRLNAIRDSFSPR